MTVAAAATSLPLSCKTCGMATTLGDCLACVCGTHCCDCVGTKIRICFDCHIPVCGACPDNAHTAFACHTRYRISQFGEACACTMENGISPLCEGTRCSHCWAQRDNGAPCDHCSRAHSAALGAGTGLPPPLMNIVIDFLGVTIEGKAVAAARRDEELRARRELACRC